MTKKELLEQIEKAKRDGTATLSLSGEGLTQLPPEISQLTQLVKLHMQFGRLTSLPPEIGQFPELRELHVYNNQLQSLPSQTG